MRVRARVRVRVRMWARVRVLRVEGEGEGWMRGLRVDLGGVAVRDQAEDAKFFIRASEHVELPTRGYPPV